MCHSCKAEQGLHNTLESKLTFELQTWGPCEAFTSFAFHSIGNGSPAHSSISETMSFNSSGLVPQRHSEWQCRRVQDGWLPAAAKGRIPKVSISLAQLHNTNATRKHKCNKCATRRQQWTCCASAMSCCTSSVLSCAGAHCMCDSEQIRTGNCSAAMRKVFNEAMSLPQRIF